jgi:hypothetical protein
MPPLENWLFFLGACAAAFVVPFAGVWIANRIDPKNRI